MRLAAFTAILLCLSAPLMAEPNVELLQQSGKFADDAQEAIELGDRRAAIVAALKGLPEAPDAATLAHFPVAYEMLFRAMAARVVNVDRETWQAYSVSSDGTRGVVMGINNTLVSNGSAPATIEFDPVTKTMVSRGGPEYLPIEEEPPHILVDPRTGEMIADLMPFGELKAAGYGPAFPPAISPDGNMVAAWHMTDGVVLRFDATDGSRLPPLDDLAGRQPGHVIGFSPDGSQIAAFADGRAAIWEAMTGTLIKAFDIPSNAISADWTYDGHLLSLQVKGYEEDSEVALSIYRDGRWREVVSLTGRTAELPTQYMQVSKTGPHVLLDEETQVDLVNYETDDVINLGLVGAAFHRFVRGGSAIAVLKEGGLFGFLSGQMTLDVMALNGSKLPPTPRDWVTFDQYVTIKGKDPESFGSLRPYAYQGDDVPDGHALWQAALALLSDAERAEVVAERIAWP